MKTEYIASLFGIDDIKDISELGGGHINRTFLVTSGSGKFVLQSLNREVFRCPEAVMRNIAALEGAFERLGDSRFAVPRFLRADGKNFVTENSEVWRMYRYGEAVPCTPEGVHERGYLTGRAFGTFIRAAEASALRLETVIDDFHSFEKYRVRLRELSPAEAGAFTPLREKLAAVFDENMPERCVHNDAKSANVVIGERCTVIDLDTAMTGYAALDYGDMIRSVSTSKNFDIEAICQVTQGFSDGLHGILTDKEVHSLYYGIQWVTNELAMRYLIDGIGKFGYFKGKTPEDCICRARELQAQSALLHGHESEIKSVIEEAFIRKF